MGFRFRRSFRVFPGLKINVSKSGVSESIGGRGGWFTIGPRGTRTTVGLPGTGLSYTEQSKSRIGAGVIFLVILMLVVLASMGAIAQTPPVEFKGVPMGATRAELLGRMPDFYCYAGICILRPYDILKHECPVTKGTACFEPALKRVRAATDFGPAPVELWTVKLRDDRVVAAFVVTDQSWFDRVVIALSEKYGPPKVHKAGMTQNRAGANFDNRTVRWDLPTGSINGEKRSAKVDKSLFMLTAGDEEQAAEQDEIKKAKASAKRL